jgi:hypothetical protein
VLYFSLASVVYNPCIGRLTIEKLRTTELCHDSRPLLLHLRQIRNSLTSLAFFLFFSSSLF